MKCIATFFLLAFLVSGCTSMRYSGKLTSPDGKHVGDLNFVTSATTPHGAAELLASVRALQDSTNGADLARRGIDKGMPVSFNTRTTQVGVGGYGGYGHVYQPLIDAEQRTFGYVPYRRFPALSPPVVQTRSPLAPAASVPQSRGALPHLRGGGREPCPSDREPVTEGERTTCLEKGQEAIAQELWPKK